MPAEDIALVNHLVVQRNCCKRAFVRGAFLASGSLSAPEKFYHHGNRMYSYGQGGAASGDYHEPRD